MYCLIISDDAGEYLSDVIDTTGIEIEYKTLNELLPIAEHFIEKDFDVVIRKIKKVK